MLQQQGSTGETRTPLRFGPRIGGDVRQVADLASGGVFAAKMLRPEGKQDDLDFSELEREVARWSDLRHPHILRIYGHMHSGQRMYMLMEFVGGCSLSRRLEEFGPMSSRLLHRALRGILEGLQFLHTREPPIPHGNLHGRNILMDSHSQVKLADFGQIGLLQPKQAASSWAAPEIAQGKVVNVLACDVWSVGCAICEMAQGECDAQAAQVPSLSALDKAARALAALCLQWDASARPPVSELLGQHFGQASDHGADAP